MKSVIIGYRRISSAIGLSYEESGSRGTWVEKRRALISTLVERGNEVRFYNNPTRASADLFSRSTAPCDFLCVEFGLHNLGHCIEDVCASVRLMAEHEGPGAFIVDDPWLMQPLVLCPSDARVLFFAEPDLPFTLDEDGSRYLLDLDWSRWQIWLNTPRAPSLRGKSGYTNFDLLSPEAKIADAPFAALLDYREPRSEYNDRFVYIGQTKGRESALETVLPLGIVDVYGKPGEWEKFGITPAAPPTQAERAEFYAGQLGCLGIADRQHLNLGWRTGRLYHALAAGTPGVVDRAHKSLAATFPSFGNGNDLLGLASAWKDPSVRRAAVEQSRAVILKEKEHFLSLLTEAGL
jgi:hypothetical protein